jgi:hypothetical protein
MTTVVRIVAAAIGLQVAVGAAPPQRETAARPAFEVATIKLSTGPSRANVVTQPAPNRLSIPGMTLKALIYVASLKVRSKTVNANFSCVVSRASQVRR